MTPEEYRHRLLSVAEECGPTQADVLSSVASTVLSDLYEYLRGDGENYWNEQALSDTIEFMEERGLE